jgi:hypothetical protein
MGTPTPLGAAQQLTWLPKLITLGTSCGMPNITTHPTNPNDAIVRRMVMSERYRDPQPAINEPYQDTIPEVSSGDT